MAAFEDAGAAGLHDELLRNFHEAGVYDFATELGIIGVDDGSLQLDPRAGPAAGGGVALLDASPARVRDALGGSAAAAAARALVLQHTRKRATDEVESDDERAGPTSDLRPGQSPPKKKRVQRATPIVDKGGKGLRHFSMKVCEKVESKGRTTYNEVADELVKEFSHPDYAAEQLFDEKNIRRRVYDALNVLMAMNIITKEKKDITWRGLPASADADMELLRAQKLRARQSCDSKHAHLAELVEQHAALEALLTRNAKARLQGTGAPPGARIALPFILVQTRPGTAVEVAMSEDKQLVHFDFNSSPFEIRDDAFVLGRLNLATVVAPAAAPAAAATAAAAAAR